MCEQFDIHDIKKGTVSVIQKGGIAHDICDKIISNFIHDHDTIVVLSSNDRWDDLFDKNEDKDIISPDNPSYSDLKLIDTAISLGGNRDSTLWIIDDVAVNSEYVIKLMTNDDYTLVVIGDLQLLQFEGLTRMDYYIANKMMCRIMIYLFNIFVSKDISYGDYRDMIRSHDTIVITNNDIRYVNIDEHSDDITNIVICI